MLPAESSATEATVVQNTDDHRLANDRVAEPEARGGRTRRVISGTEGSGRFFPVQEGLSGSQRQSLRSLIWPKSYPDLRFFSAASRSLRGGVQSLRHLRAARAAAERGVSELSGASPRWESCLRRRPVRRFPQNGKRRWDRDSRCYD